MKKNLESEPTRQSGRDKTEPNRRNKRKHISGAFAFWPVFCISFCLFCFYCCFCFYSTGAFHKVDRKTYTKLGVWSKISRAKKKRVRGGKMKSEFVSFHCHFHGIFTHIHTTILSTPPTLLRLPTYSFQFLPFRATGDCKFLARTERPNTFSGFLARRR